MARGPRPGPGWALLRGQGVAQLPRRRELKMGALDLGKMGVSCKEKKILGSPEHPTTRRSKLPPRPHLKSSQCAAEGWSWMRNRHGAGDAPADNPGHAENRVRTIPATPWTQVDSRGRAGGSELGRSSRRGTRQRSSRCLPGHHRRELLSYYRTHRGRPSAAACECLLPPPPPT